MSRLKAGLFEACFVVLLSATPLLGQYPGQVQKKSKDNAQLRAIAVLEWTGEAGKPKECRIVPVTVYDGQQLQDGGVYLARPQPLALAGEVEYQLKDNGRTIGIFDVKNSGQIEGAWVGFGEWKGLPKPKAEVAPPAKIDTEDDSDDKPVLHRKSHAADSSSKSGDSGASKDKSKTGDKTDDTPSTTSGVDTDTDRPTLHKKTDDSSSNSQNNSAGTAPVDPDRPVMKKPTPAPAQVPADDVGNVTALAGVTDPDRPRLKHGLSNADSLKVIPTLMGLPPDMEQAVAVSDAQNHPDHPWVFSWASPGDEDKMKAQLEDLARQALGIAQPAPAATPPAAKATTRSAAARKRAAQPVPPPEPVPLQDEQFRVFELAYGSGATIVLTADTGGSLASEKFATIIAQPDLYGNVLVLMKNVTDGSHLDESPRMRLVDAVDALADNRGELLFELRGETSRQFALYRVLRGRADKIFSSFAGNVNNMAAN
ncbi:MAG TPA: hypothetical protein VGJ21_14070 [Terracidiphilus sp.]